VTFSGTKLLKTLIEGQWFSIKMEKMQAKAGNSFFMLLLIQIGGADHDKTSIKSIRSLCNEL